MLLTFFEEFEHYMLNDSIPEYIVNELFEQGRRVNITMILIELFKRKLFEPMSEEIINKLDFSFEKGSDPYNYYRPIEIKQRRTDLSKSIQYGKLLFGFDTTEHNFVILLR